MENFYEENKEIFDKYLAEIEEASKKEQEEREAKWKDHEDMLNSMTLEERIEYEDTMKMFKDAGLDKASNLQLLEYVYDMPVQMAAADIVITRAGAMTISEIALNHKAAIMIPSPNVTNNHQYKNAKVLADRGAGILIEESEIMNEELENSVKRLLSDEGLRRSMSEACSDIAHPDVNDVIFDEIVSLIEKSR